MNIMVYVNSEIYLKYSKNLGDKCKLFDEFILFVIYGGLFSTDFNYKAIL
jgi:hypothetical protein